MSYDFHTISSIHRYSPNFPPSNFGEITISMWKRKTTKMTSIFPDLKLNVAATRSQIYLIGAVGAHRSTNFSLSPLIIKLINCFPHIYSFSSLLVAQELSR